MDHRNKFFEFDNAISTSEEGKEEDEEAIERRAHWFMRWLRYLSIVLRIKAHKIISKL